MKIAYVRVSTEMQHEDRQEIELKKYDIDKWYIEKKSGKNIEDREQLKRLLSAVEDGFIGEGDTIYVHDFSRLARSVKDLLDITDMFKAKGINFVSIHEQIDTSTPSGKLMLTMIGAIYEFELSNMKSRQREGIEARKQKDKELPPEERAYKGRKAITVDKDYFKELYDKYMGRVISKVEFAKRLEVSRPTLDKLIKEYKESEEV